MRVALLMVFCFCIISTYPSKALAETPTSKIGVIVLHPKWSMPAKILRDFQWYDQEERFRKFQTWCDTGPWVCSDDQIIVANERNDSSILTIDFYEDFLRGRELATLISCIGFSNKSICMILEGFGLLTT